MQNASLLFIGENAVGFMAVGFLYYVISKIKVLGEKFTVGF